jgi:hypothetical protein
MPIRMTDVQEGSNVALQPPSTEQVFAVTLPSQGRHGYPSTLTFRPLKVADIKPLVRATDETELGYIRRMISVLQGTLYSTTANTSQISLTDLTLPDLKKVILAHRVNSIGALADISYTCDCGANGRMKLDLMQLDETTIPNNFTEPMTLSCGIQVQFPRASGYFPKGKDWFREVDDFDVLESVVMGRKVDDLSLAEMKEALEFVRKWEGSYGIKETTVARCSTCGKEVEVTIPFFLLIVQW